MLIFIYNCFGIQQINALGILWFGYNPNALGIGEGGVISEKIYFCDSRARLKTWNYELFVQNCR